MAIDATIDLRLRNVAILETRGLDLSGEYRLDAGLGRLTAGVTATYVIDYEQAWAVRWHR